MNREILDRRFTTDQILERTDAHGEVFSYVQGALVIQRLNEAFDADWSFTISEYRAEATEVIVIGQLTAGGQTKTQVGNKVRDGGGTLGDEMKAAWTDCIKKCATLFGIGLHLYFNESPVVAAAPAPPTAKADPMFERRVPALPVAWQPGAPPPRERPITFAGAPVTPLDPAPAFALISEDAGRVSNKQLSCIFAKAKTIGMSSKQIRAYAVDKFKKVPDYLSKREASSLIDLLAGLEKRGK